MNNPNKAISAKPYGIIVSYTDTQKHYKIDYEPSVLSNQQVYSNSSVQNKVSVSPVQNKMWRHAMYGLKAYSKQELEAMSKAEKHSIIVYYTKAQRVINRLKNIRSQALFNNFMTRLFYKSRLAKELAEFEDYEVLNGKNNMSLKELGITQEMIVEQLIHHHIFPRKFYSL